MQLIKKSLLALLLILFLIVFVAYFLLQTNWGARKLTYWLSYATQWHLSLTNIKHSFSKPSYITLYHFTFGHDGQPAMIVADKVDIKLSLSQLKKWSHFDTIMLSHGEINFARLNDKDQLPIQADFLQLDTMKINHPNYALPLFATHVTGGITPWKPEVTNLLGNKAHFRVSADSINVGFIPLKQVFIEGKVENNNLQLTKIGANLANGSITGRARRDEQKKWILDNISLSGVRLQTSHRLEDFSSFFTLLPSITIKQMDFTDVRLQGPDWAVSDFALSLKDISYHDHHWQSDNGSIAINASDLVYQNINIVNPYLNIHFTPDLVTLKALNLHWANGILRTAGQWMRATKRLVLDELAITGMEITLPTAWRDFWITPLPKWLENVEVKKFSLGQNLLIDINKMFPFQITALNGLGENVVLAKQHQLGFWQGKMHFNAADATFNRTDLREPSIQLEADNQQIKITELSTMIGKGLLEGKLTIGQQEERALKLSLSARAVDANILHNWGWPTLPTSGITNQQLELTANLKGKVPLSDSINGVLNVTTNNHTFKQTMINGIIQPDHANN